MAGLFKKCRHPFVTFLNFAAVICLTVAVKNPVYLCVSFISGLALNLVIKNFSGLVTVLKLLPFFVFLSCLNPLVSHYGQTVLFYVLGDAEKPFTLEALCWGLNSAFMMVTVVMWCLAFSKILTAEKLTYIFAPLFPSLSVMFVMILRLIPFFQRRSVEISEGRKGLGLDSGGGFFKKLKEKFIVLTAVTSSTLEDGTYTAQSMVERGWGRTRRTSFINYRFRFADFIVMAAAVIFCGVCIAGIIKGAGAFSVYPVIDAGDFTGNLWNQVTLLSDWLLMMVLIVFCTGDVQKGCGSL